MKFKGKAAEPNRVKENVWHPGEGRIIAVIENGIYETDNEDTIQQLKELGYDEYIEVVEKQIEKPDDTPMTRKRDPKENQVSKPKKGGKK
jgi:hypothetical protein